MAKKAIILGGGITGLTAGFKLAEAGYEIVVIEKEDQLGGQARTIKRGGYYLDLGAHKIFTVMEHAHKFLADLAGDDLLTRPKKGRIRYGDVYLPFPVGVKDMVRQLPFTKLAYLTMSLMKAKLANLFRKKDPKTYEDWFVINYGRGIYREFVQEATEKIWGVASNLSADLAKRRVTSPNLWELIKQTVFGIKINRVTSTDIFYYPKYGCQIFPDRLADRIKALGAGNRVLLSTTVDKIVTQDHRISAMHLSNGEKIDLNQGDVVISSIPKRSFANILDQPLPGDVEYHLMLLRERNMLLIYIMLDQEQVMEDNWIFFPEARFPFNRLFEQKNCSPFMVPEGKTMLCAEMTCHVDQHFTESSRAFIVGKAIQSLHDIGLIDKAKVCDTHTIYLEHAYPLWDVSYKEHVDKVMGYLDSFNNLYTVGRQGGFVYGGIADCVDIGLVTAKFISDGRRREEWPKERTRFDDYVVVD